MLPRALILVIAAATLVAVLAAPAPADAALSITTSLYFPSKAECQKATSLGLRFFVTTSNRLTCKKLSYKYPTRAAAPCSKSGNEFFKQWCYDNDTLPYVGGIMGWTVSKTLTPYAGLHGRGRYYQTLDSRTKCPKPIPALVQKPFQDSTFASMSWVFYKMSNPVEDNLRPAQCTQGTGRYLTCDAKIFDGVIYTGCGPITNHPFKQKV